LNVLYLLAIFFMFTFCYMAMRRLSVRPWLAAAAGIAFVVSPYFKVRSGGHDTLAMYYGVPLGATIALLLGTTDRARLRATLLEPFVLFAIIVSAISGLYYAFFTAMFVMVTASARAAMRREPAWLIAGAAICGVLLLLLVTSGYSVALGDLITGNVPIPPARLPMEQLMFGLSMTDAVKPVRDVGLFKQRFDEFMRTAGPVTEGRGFEWPGLVLGAIILLAPLMLVARVFGEPQRPDDRRGQMSWLSHALITFGLLFAIRGGFGFLFNYFVNPTIRAPSRIIPFLAFYALVVFCLGIERLSEIGAPRWRTVAGGLATIGLLASAWPSAQIMSEKQFAYASSGPLQENRHSVEALLNAVHEAQIQAVLQMPYVYWPEAEMIRNFSSYDHQIPYVLDRAHATTRWSYGQTWKQPVFAKIDAALADSASTVTEVAKAWNFDAILIEKTAYTPAEIAKLRASAKLDMACDLYEDTLRLLIALRETCDAGNDQRGKKP
jgi:hypothetical protein